MRTGSLRPPHSTRARHLTGFQSGQLVRSCVVPRHRRPATRRPRNRKEGLCPWRAPGAENAEEWSGVIGSRDASRERRDLAWPPWRAWSEGRDDGVGAIILRGTMLVGAGCRVGGSRRAGNISGNQGDQPDSCDGATSCSVERGNIHPHARRLNPRRETQMKRNTQFIHSRSS
jgi:hypothetical protein